MAMLDKMKDSINAAGQGISTKIKDGLESERISAKIRDDEKMIEKLTYQVGVQCVKRHAEETGTEYEELFAEIRRLRAQIKKEKEELRLATEVKPCPQCGYGNKISSKFCVKCGSSLAVKETSDVSELKEKYCTNCGFKNDGDALFCINCGNKLEEVSRQTMPEPEPEEVNRQTMPEPEPEEVSRQTIPEPEPENISMPEPESEVLAEAISENVPELKAEGEPEPEVLADIEEALEETAQEITEEELKEEKIKEEN